MAGEAPEVERGTSWIGALIGMLTALGAALLLSGIIGGIVALVVVALLEAGGGSETGAGIASIVGGFGYVVSVLPDGRVRGRAGGEPQGDQTRPVGGPAGRARYDTAGDDRRLRGGVGISDNLSGVVLPDGPADDQQGLGSLLALSAVSGILVLLFPFVGGAIGGAWGARTGRRRP